MELLVREQLYITTKNHTLIKELKGLLTKPNPEFQKKRSMGYPVWDIPPRIIMYENISSGKDGLYKIAIPRGTGRMARELCKKHNELLKVIDKRTYLKENIDVKLMGGVVSLWYQKDATFAMNEEEQGMIDAPCGSGKTIMGLFFIAQHTKATMIVVHTLDLFRQWIDRIGEFLEGDFTIGQFGDGKKKHGDITICMIQTIHKLSKLEWKKFQERYSIFIGDECHHFGANTYMTVMKNIASKFIIGLSATPKRNDKKDFIVNAYLGKVIYKISDDDLECSGQTVTCKINIVNTNRKYNYTKMGENHSVLGTILSKDKDRNEIIVSKICQDLDDGKVPMVLTERVYHAKFLVSLLKEKGISVGSITGAIDTDTRDKIKSQMRKGELEVLVANKHIAAEGLDIPIVDSIHVAFYTFNESLIKQMIGRGRRSYDNKEYCQVWLYKDSLYTLVVNNNFEKVSKPHNGNRYGWSRLTNFFHKQNFEINYVEYNDGVLL